MLIVLFSSQPSLEHEGRLLQLRDAPDREPRLPEQAAAHARRRVICSSASGLAARAVDGRCPNALKRPASTKSASRPNRLRRTQMCQPRPCMSRYAAELDSLRGIRHGAGFTMGGRSLSGATTSWVRRVRLGEPGRRRTSCASSSGRAARAGVAARRAPRLDDGEAGQRARRRSRPTRPARGRGGVGSATLDRRLVVRHAGRNSVTAPAKTPASASSTIWTLGRSRSSRTCPTVASAGSVFGSRSMTSATTAPSATLRSGSAHRSSV